MKYFMHLRERPFNAIKKGSKKIEGRVPGELNSRYHQMIPYTALGVSAVLGGNGDRV